MRKNKSSTLMTLEAVSILLIFGGLVLTPSAALLSQSFPKINLEPIYVSGGSNLTETFQINETGIYFQPIYLDYGEAISGFYISNRPVTFYLFDLNSFSSYINNPVSQAIKSMETSYFGLVNFMPSTPGVCSILIINPLRYHPVQGEITLYRYSAFPIITSNNTYTCCLYFAFLGFIISALGISFYITAKHYEKKK